MKAHIEKNNPRAIRSAMALNVSDFEEYQHRHVRRLIQMGGKLAIVKANDGSVDIVQSYASPDSGLSVNLDACAATDLRPRHLRPDSLAFAAYCT